jgi:hypothetical protein
MSASKPSAPLGAPPLEPRARIGVQVHPAVGEDWPADGLGPVEPLAEQLPDPTRLAPGTWVAIRPGRDARAPGWVGRLLGRRRARVHVAVRCTALLARGYVHVCADQADTAYGQAPLHAGVSSARRSP